MIFNNIYTLLVLIEKFAIFNKQLSGFWLVEVILVSLHPTLISCTTLILIMSLVFRVNSVKNLSWWKIELTVLSITYFVIVCCLMLFVNVKQSSNVLPLTLTVHSIPSLSISRWFVDLLSLSSGSEPNTCGELLLNLVRLKPLEA